MSCKCCAVDPSGLFVLYLTHPRNRHDLTDDALMPLDFCLCASETCFHFHCTPSTQAADPCKQVNETRAFTRIIVATTSPTRQRGRSCVTPISQWDHIPSLAIRRDRTFLQQSIKPCIQLSYTPLYGTFIHRRVGGYNNSSKYVMSKEQRRERRP